MIANESSFSFKQFFFTPIKHYILGSGYATNAEEDIAMTTLALRTLGTFDFEGMNFLPNLKKNIPSKLSKSVQKYLNFSKLLKYEFFVFFLSNLTLI